MLSIILDKISWFSLPSLLCLLTESLYASLSFTLIFSNSEGDSDTRLATIFFDFTYYLAFFQLVSVSIAIFCSHYSTPNSKYIKQNIAFFFLSSRTKSTFPLVPLGITAMGIFRFVAYAWLRYLIIRNCLIERQL